MLSYAQLKQPLKTGVAAAVATIIYQVFHLSHGYWVVISAVIVMQSNLGRAIAAGVSRLIGTAVGAAVGTLALWLAGLHVVSVLVAVTVTMWICSGTKLRESQRLAGVTAVIVMLVREESVWRAGAARFIDVALGIVVALAVSLAWPSRARTDLRISLASSFRDLDSLFSLVSACLGQDCDTPAIERGKALVRENSQRNLDLARDIEREPGHGDRLLTGLFQSSERIREHIFGIDYSSRSMARDSFFHQLDEPLNRLFSAVRQTVVLIIAELRDESRPAAAPLQGALQELENRFSDLRAAGATRPFPTEELMRFYSLFYRSRQLADELTRCVEFANALDHATSHGPADTNSPSVQRFGAE
ncbi:MAG: FUSC family protein [Burkholderiales bacterium]